MGWYIKGDGYIENAGRYWFQWVLEVRYDCTILFLRHQLVCGILPLYVA